MEPVRIGIAGLGRAGMGMHLYELEGKEDKFKLVAVCDPIKERRDFAAAKYGCKTYEDIADLIADPDVELVDIATRSLDHHDHAKAALLAGKHVLLEKPMSCNYADAKELAALGKVTPRLFIRHNRRWEGKFTQINEIIESGILGEVYEIKLTRNSFTTRNDWQTISSYGGGQLLNWGPHIVDHALSFCGGEYTELYSEVKQINASGDCEDHVKIVLTGINGRIVDMEISSGAALPTPEYLVYGSRGALRDDGDRLHLRYVKPAEVIPRKVPDPGTPMAGFAQAPEIEWIEEDVPARGDGKLDQTWDAVYAELREGKPYLIKLSEATEVIKVIDEVKKRASVE